jgi:hypothetical protein
MKEPGRLLWALRKMYAELLLKEVSPRDFCILTTMLKLLGPADTHWVKEIEVLKFANQARDPPDSPPFTLFELRGLIELFASQLKFDGNYPDRIVCVPEVQDFEMVFDRALFADESRFPVEK